MASTAPRTLSVKRKRGEAPVDSLVIEKNNKRRNTGNPLFFKLASTVDRQSPLSKPTLPSPGPRLFHFEHGNGALVLIEKKEPDAPAAANEEPSALPVQDDTSPRQRNNRKRPGTGVNSKGFGANIKRQIAEKGIVRPAEPTADAVNEYERLAAQVEKQEVSENLEKTEISPIKKPGTLKYHPKAPALRYKDRNLASQTNGASDRMEAVGIEAQDVDMEDAEWVYDTYIQEEVQLADPLDAAQESMGSVGFIVITDQDEEFWEMYGQDEESEREFDTDDEDENAEDYYGADYPEDEVASDDEYDINPYQYNHGSEDEEYDAERAAWSDDDEIALSWHRKAHLAVDNTN